MICPKHAYAHPKGDLCPNVVLAKAEARKARRAVKSQETAQLAILGGVPGPEPGRHASNARPMRRYRPKRATGKPGAKKRKKSPSLSKLKKLLWAELRGVVYAMSEFCLTCGSTDSPVACHIVPSSEGAITAFFLPNIYRGCNSCNKAEVSRRGQWVKRFEEVFGADYVNALYQMVSDEISKPINERFQIKKWWVLEQTERMRKMRVDKTTLSNVH